MSLTTGAPPRAIRPELRTRRTVDEWELEVGKAVRAARKQQRLTQAELAQRSDVSENTIRNLETGKGSTLGSLIRVTRSLDMLDWIDTLTPPAPAVSPLEALAASRRR